MEPVGTTNFVTELSNRMSGPIAPAPEAAPAAPAPVQEAPAAADDVTIEKPAAPVAKASTPLKTGVDALDIEEDSTDTPEPEKTEESEDEKPPADAKTPEAKNAWTKSRNEIKELKAAQAALLAEKERLAKELELKKGIAENDPVKVELENLRKEREEWQKEAAKYRIEQTDAYKDAVTKPLNSIGNAAAEIAKRNEVDQTKLFAALREPDEKLQNEKIQEIVENMSERDKLRVWNLADQLQSVYARQDELEANAHAALTEAQAREAEESSKKQLAAKAEEMRAVEDLRPKLAKAARLFKLEGETDEDAVNKILTAANEVPFNEHDTNTKAFSVVAASILPRLLKNNQSLSKQVQTLEKELAAYGKAGARTSEGTKQSSAAAKPAGFDGVLAAIKNDLANMGMPNY